MKETMIATICVIITITIIFLWQSPCGYIGKRQFKDRRQQVMIKKSFFLQISECYKKVTSYPIDGEASMAQPLSMVISAPIYPPGQGHQVCGIPDIQWELLHPRLDPVKAAWWRHSTGVESPSSERAPHDFLTAQTGDWWLYTNNWRFLIWCWNHSPHTRKIYKFLLLRKTISVVSSFTQ